MSEQERKEDVLTEGNAGDNLGQVSGALKALLPELANIRQILTGNRVFDNSDDGYMSIQKAANWLSVSCDTIRRALQIGTLKAYRLPGGKTIRLRKSELEALLQVSRNPRARKS